MTDAERFALDSYGTAPGPQSVPSAFKEYLGKLQQRTAQGQEHDKQAGSAFKSYLQSAGKSYSAFENDHPALKWGRMALPMVLSPGGAIDAIRPAGMAVDNAINGQTKEQSAANVFGPETSKFDYQKMGVNTSALPLTAASMAPSAVSGPQAASGTGGFQVPGGTDKSVYEAQQDYVADHSGLQEKKGEEASAHLQAMGVRADQFQELAQAQTLAANAERQAVDDAEKEQLKAEQDWHTAQDETAKKGIDPGRFYKNKDAGFWISMIIGSVASGMLSGLTQDGKNPFIDSVRDMVRQDIGAQETDINQGWKKVKGLETAYERARQRGVDRVTATLRQYDATLSALQTDMQGRYERATIPETKARLEAGLQALQMERDGIRIKNEEYWRDIKARRAAAAAAAANAAAEKAFQHALAVRKQAMEEKKTDAEVRKLDAETLESGGGGTFVPTGSFQDESGIAGQQGFLAPSKQAKEDMTKARASGEAYIGELQQLATARQAYKKAIADGLQSGDPRKMLEAKNMRAKLETMGADITTRYGKDNALGTLDKGLQEHAGTVHGDATSIGTDVDAKIEQQIANAQNKLKTLEGSTGGQKAIRYVDPQTGRSVVRPMGGYMQPPSNATPETIPGARVIK